MDFFQSQDRARRNTKLLLGLYVAAVVCIILLTNVLVLMVGGLQTSASMGGAETGFSWGLFLGVSLLVVMMVGLGSAYRIHALSKGGSVVAEMLDGELLLDAGGDLEKRRLLNVVEEMALAAGTPVPPVYLIPDAAINAFAAGYSPGDAVIGITQGALHNLNRDQLQGVVAHEFSHILNGDMRLNIRLMGVLYGILMLAVVGRLVLHGSRGRSSSKRDGGGAILAIGLGLLVLGYVGKFFGSLIKAAVSRQREYLADASAVQFTRYPAGISGALKRIGGYEAGSVLQHPESEELSHAFFSSGVSFAFGSLMSTHPPLEERIRRLDPGWDGGYITQVMPDRSESAPKPEVAGMASGFAGGGVHTGVRINAEQVFDAMGQPGAAQLAEARHVLAAIPQALLSAARQTYSARALVYLLLLDQVPSVRAVQMAHLAGAADATVVDALNKMLAQAAGIELFMRLPLLEIAMPALRQLSHRQYTVFMANIDVLIRADKKLGLGEWALQKYVSKHLGEAFEQRHRAPRHLDLAVVRDDCARLLSVLAYTDATSTTVPAEAFAMGQAQLGMAMVLLAKADLGARALDAAVDNLAELRPLLKPRLLKACIATITADGIATAQEVELVRTIADALDCPMPPIVLQR
jgi:Zn-dependent protease with chaperone function